MTTRLRRHGPGFSLLELLVALVISLVVVAGALALMQAQERNFQTTSGDRYLQEASRVALGHLGDNLTRAGFGVDPALAFDLGPMNGVRMDRAWKNQTFSTTSAPMAGGAACGPLCRDSTTGPDELVFYARDPAFGPHPLTIAPSSASASLTLAGPIRVPLLAGQVLQVVCYGGNMTWAYVQVSGSSTVNGDGSVTVPIAGSGAANFPRQNPWLDDPCFGNVATMIGGAVSVASLGTATEVFKVDRFHYFIQSYDAAGQVQPWGTVGSRPYLMLDQGLSDAGGNPVVSAIAPDVEDLQLAYVFPSDAVTPLVGATPGTALSNDDTGVNLAPASGGPAYSDPLTSPTRLNHHPGNIGAVRVSVVVRSASADPTAGEQQHRAGVGQPGHAGRPARLPPPAGRHHGGGAQPRRPGALLPRLRRLPVGVGDPAAQRRRRMRRSA